MKKIIIFFIVFIITIILIIKLNISYSNEKIDFSEYYLKGFFKLDECHVEKDNKELCKKEYFSIYDNKIVSVSKIKDKDNYKENYKKVKNGIYKLITSEGSKIKIKVKDGYIKNFKLPSDLVGFKRSEKKIGYTKNCYIAYQEGIFNIAYNINKKMIFIIDDKDKNNFLITNYDDKYIIITIENIDSNLNISLFWQDLYLKVDNSVLYKDKKEGNKVYFYKKIERMRAYEDYDLKTENCVIKYFNKDKLPLEF